MSTSVVVVAHRAHDWLERCVASVRDQAGEIIVVDNGSANGAVSTIASAAGARPIRLDENRGFAGGVNAGVSESRGDLIALLNDDAFAEPGWLAAAEQTLGRADIGAATPKVVFTHPFAVLRIHDEPRDAPADPRSLGRALRSVTVNGREMLTSLIGPGIHQLETGTLDGKPGPWRWTTGRDPIYVALPAGDEPCNIQVDGAAWEVDEVVRIINSAGTYISAFGFGGDYGFGSPDDGSFDEPADRFGACGAALVARAETFRSVGRLAEDFFAYYEDLDWSWRVQLAALRVWYDPSATVNHFGGLTSGGPNDPGVVRLAARNRVLCLARNAPLRMLPAEAKRAVSMHPRSGLTRSFAARIPKALLQRRELASRWRRRPEDVWAQWAGVNERWPASAPS